LKLTQLSLGNPVAVAVGGILLALFGMIALSRLPIQLTPDVERPRIFIGTDWRGAAPREVESEILEPQENALRGMPGVIKMTSVSEQGESEITLELSPDVDLDRALLEVLNRLNQVPDYPEDAEEPFINTGGRGNQGAIAWFALHPADDNPRDIVSYQTFVDETILPRIERVPGMASANAFGGRREVIRIRFDPYRAADLGVDLSRIPALMAGNQDVSGGRADVGRRQYTIRYAGKFDIDEFGDMVLDWRDGRPVHLRDIAEINIGLADPSGTLSQNGQPSIAMNAIPEVGVNVLRVMDDLKAVIEEIREGPLASAGLTIEQVYDETEYIYSSIQMVQTNLVLGIMLAIGILWWFLRKFRATLMVALAIPLCLLASFLGLYATGRTLNTISLAGLAFAVGMVLDAAIVVLENIVRLRERGHDADEAASLGAGQVWGALLASTSTTVAVFLPVVFLQDVAGQLFADLALTIAIAVVASLFVALTVIPTGAKVWLRHARLDDPHKEWWDRMADGVMTLTDTPKRRWGWIAALVTIPVLVVVLLRPEADYLPEGQQNLIRASIQAPPGMNVPTVREEVIGVLNDRLRPHLNGKAEPAVESYWLGVFGSFGFMGIRAEDRREVPALLDVLNEDIFQGIPDTQINASRAAVFGRLGGGRSIEVDLQSGDTEALLAAGRHGVERLPQVLPGAQVRADPGLELAEPELRLVPDDRRIAEVGWDRRQLAIVSQALGDGAFVGEYFDGDRRLNVMLESEQWVTPDEMTALPVATPSGDVMPLGSLAELNYTAGPAEIRRVDRRRTLTLNVTPPKDKSLEVAIDRIRNEVAPELREMLPPGAFISYSGTADSLNRALGSMSQSFVLAIIILYLLISALFRSFRDSLLVVLTIPLATFGGVLGLNVLNAVGFFQPMDLLTMIGFVIVLGLVVNNAILLVHQARMGEREEGLNRAEAVNDAVHRRLRPILMSTLTTLFGMLPLVVIPGAGTELYRGMATVIVGGMAVSALFTLLLLPSLLRLGEEARETAAGKGSLRPGYAQR
jgi:multidrug efflux pump subunit AcrB